MGALESSRELHHGWANTHGSWVRVWQALVRGEHRIRMGLLGSGRHESLLYLHILVVVL